MLKSAAALLSHISCKLHVLVLIIWPITQ